MCLHGDYTITIHCFVLLLFHALFLAGLLARFLSCSLCTCIQPCHWRPYKEESIYWITWFLNHCNHHLSRNSLRIHGSSMLVPIGRINCPRPTNGKTAHTLDLMQSCMCLKVTSLQRIKTLLPVWCTLRIESLSKVCVWQVYSNKTTHK